MSSAIRSYTDNAIRADRGGGWGGVREAPAYHELQSAVASKTPPQPPAGTSVANRGGLGGAKRSSTNWFAQLRHEFATSVRPTVNNPARRWTGGLSWQ
jgi:hypothetical protein